MATHPVFTPGGCRPEGAASRGQFRFAGRRPYRTVPRRQLPDRTLYAFEKFLDQLGIKHAILVGNSLGGRISWETAVARPDLADRLVLIDSRGYPGEAGPDPIAVKIATSPGLGSVVDRAHHAAKRNRKESRASVRRSAKADTECGGPLLRVAPALWKPAGADSADEQESYTDSGRIPTITIPTLILWGELDHVVPVPDAERFRHDITHSQLVVFKQWGHVPQEEDPAHAGGLSGALRLSQRCKCSLKSLTF
jgi:pimeloyl-ACP methyl ester carboxylesterase